MSKKIVCVVPTIRPESHAKFLSMWRELFKMHSVTLVTVWDGDSPRITVDDFSSPSVQKEEEEEVLCDGLTSRSVRELPGFENNRDLFCRRTDACRNLGFVKAAELKADYVLTLDDDVYPLSYCDPILQHLEALNLKTSLCWMNTADSFHTKTVYVRGIPYTSRTEAPVMLSHGVWYGVPDLDGETQLKMESEGNGIVDLFFHVGTIPKGVLFPLCGMNVMVRKEALPYFYFAPMGPDTGIEGLHRFADIFMGIFLKREFDDLGWGCATGYSAVHHSRASDAKKNMEAERLGREWLEDVASWVDVSIFYRRISRFDIGTDNNEVMTKYFRDYGAKRQKYASLIRDIQGRK